MQKPKSHPQENLRIKTLQSMNVLDSKPEARFDRLTQYISSVLDVPIALISLIDTDRQWFKSQIGLSEDGSITETPRDISFCAHAIHNENVFIINDALKDERFADNPLVLDDPNIRFYAGSPLLHPNGSPLGTLCVIDSKPRELKPRDIELLREIAAIVELELMQTHSTAVDEESQLSNKEGFLLLGKHSLEVCKRLNLSVSVAFLFAKGLAYYRDNNKVYHRAISLISQQFSQHFRRSDVVARYDPSGFVALMTNVNEQSAKETLNQVVQDINAALQQLNLQHPIEFATGLITSDAHSDLEKLVFDAFVKVQD